MAITVTKENFESEVINSNQVVLLDFWASWCGPCKMLMPIIDQVSAEVTDKKICKINVDEQPELASQFGIMSIPTLVVIKNGVEVNRTMGVQPKDSILKMLDC